MAVCLLNQDVLRSTFCGYSLGAISRIYLANYEDVSATTIDTSSGQSVTGITMASGKTFYAIDPAKNSANWSDTLVVSDDGSKYRTHQVVFNIVGTYTPELADVVDALSLGKYVAVLEKNDGNSVMLGRTAGVEAEAVVLGGSDDGSVTNGIQVTLNANTAEVALPMSAEAMAVVKSGN